jgi:hypothetical protein
MNMKKFGLFEMGSGNSKPLEMWDADDIVTGKDPCTVIVLRDTDTRLNRPMMETITPAELRG